MSRGTTQGTEIKPNVNEAFFVKRDLPPTTPTWWPRNAFEVLTYGQMTYLDFARP